MFISHGAPTVALSPGSAYARALAAWAAGIPRPDAIVTLSAHWEVAGPVRVTSGVNPPVIHDFGGFPEPLYRMTYPAPGAPELAAEIVTLLSAASVPAVLEPRRGWDHGVWIPLRLAFPSADIPVVQISLPASAVPEEVMLMGKALAALRQMGVVLLGSGGVVHNLRLLRYDNEGAPVDAWAVEFDNWVRARLEDNAIGALRRYREEAPGAGLAVPTTEHFNPIFFVLGAVSETDRTDSLYEGFQYGNLSLRCFEMRS